MTQYIGVYFEADETLVSAEGIYTNAIAKEVRADLDEESVPVEMYVEADEGYIAYDVELFLSGDEADMWRIADSLIGIDLAVWGASLNIGTVEFGVLNRVPFFIQTKAVNTEIPVLDTSVLVLAEGLVEPVVP